MSEYTSTGMYWKCNLCKGLSLRQVPYCVHCFEGMAPDVTKEVRPERLSEEVRPDILPDIDSAWRVMLDAKGNVAGHFRKLPCGWVEWVSAYE